MQSTATPSGLVRGDKPVTDWPTIRTWVLDRDDWMCQICKAADATDADHIWPRRLGGKDHVDNLRAACGPCNKSKGARVDLGTVRLAQLRAAIDATDARIAALEAEREIYEEAKFGAAMANWTWAEIADARTEALAGLNRSTQAIAFLNELLEHHDCSPRWPGPRAA